MSLIDLGDVTVFREYVVAVRDTSSYNPGGESSTHIYLSKDVAGEDVFRTKTPYAEVLEKLEIKVDDPRAERIEEVVTYCRGVLTTTRDHGGSPESATIATGVLQLLGEEPVK